MGLEPPTGGYGRFDKRNSLPVWLQWAGYYSTHISKFLNGYGSDTPADVPPGWSEWYGAVDPTTYRMWGFTLNENGTRRTYGSPFLQDPRLYQTDVYRRKAIDFIERRADKRKPFFLSVGFLAPHHEEARIRALTGRSVRPAPRHDGARAGAPASDNGFIQGEHRVTSGKMLAYEPSARVPLLIVGPGIPKARTSNELVTNEDLAPTILAIARARAGKAVDGRSLLPFARHPKRRSGRLLLHETGGLKPVIPEEDAGPIRQLRRILTCRAVRTPRWLWVQYRNGSRELYDLVRDPQQLHSHHADARYRRIRFALGRELRRLSKCRGGPCRTSGGPIPGPTRR